MMKPLCKTNGMAVSLCYKKKEKGMVQNVEIYFAPLEGITTYIYRNLFQKYFGGIDKYFMPFVAPGSNKGLKKKEIRDIHPENNKNISVVPQILTNSIDNFLKTEALLKDFGYQEININLGCPVGTVVAKKKGSGMLGDTYLLEEFLDGIFEKSTSQISIKTRIGMTDPIESEEILKIYNKYPLKELIIHPRLRIDYYNNTTNMQIYNKMLQNAKTSVCYNGDINAREDFERIITEYTGTDSVMLGRGLITNPFLAKQIAGEEEKDREKIRNFVEELFLSYAEMMGEVNAFYKMKELWFYMSKMFRDGQKYYKRIKKTTNISEYHYIIEEIFES